MNLELRIKLRPARFGVQRKYKKNGGGGRYILNKYIDLVIIFV